MCEHCWGNVPGSPYFEEVEEEELNANEISDAFLLYRYSSLLKQIESLYSEKKELEKEIAARKDRLEHMVQTGQIKMESDFSGQSFDL
jgi:hypothetical protein